MNKFSVEGKVCLITGGLGYLGGSVINFVHSRGAKVWITDTAPEAECKEVLKVKYKENWGYSTLDVRKPEELEEAFERCANEFGRPDIFFNFIEEHGEDAWNEIYDVNVKGTHRSIECGMKHMDKKHDGKEGVIVNISSFVGVSCRGDPFASLPAFTTSHHAVVALTRTFGSDMYYDRTGVRVICVTPYYVDGCKMAHNGFESLTSDKEARKRIGEADKGKKHLTGEEAALRIINVLNAKNGSVWYVRPNILQPINIPDNRLPN